MQYINEEITSRPRCGAIGDSKDTKKRKKAQGNNHIRRFNYQMQLNWFRRAFDKKAAQELGSLVSFEVCY